MATKEEAKQACLSVVKNDLISQIMVDKYFLCDGENYLETTPPQVWDRLATAIVEPELPENRAFWRKRFYNLLTDFKFVPGGRIMYGLGNRFSLATLKNCYVTGIQEDSMRGIFDCGWQMAETYKTGGGNGSDISPLRPRGSPVHNAARFSSGSTTFMQFFSTITGMIGQCGRIGALMLSIDSSHPDVFDFVKIKTSTQGTVVLPDGTQVKGDSLDWVRYANISIKAYDEFMQAVSDDKPYTLRWGGKTYETIQARDLWNLIMENAWKRAEPGLLFWDAVLREYPAAQYEQFRPISTNPCGELALSHGDSCCLGSINLARYVRQPFRQESYFDYAALDQDTRDSTRFLDNVISIEKSPLEFQQWANDNGRRLGLGIMGLADVFLKMRVKFDSDQALEIADKVLHQFMVSTYDASCELAKEKGAFPIFDKNKHMKSEFIKRLPEPILEKLNKTGTRNVGNQAIAPCGTIAIIAECANAMEPVFAIVQKRMLNLGTSKGDKQFEVWHKTAKDYSEEFNCPSDKLPDYFQGVHQVDIKARLRMQAVVQKKIDQSISNTFNLPKHATVKEIGDLYMDAWRQGLKGVTVYREGSREGVISDATAQKPDNIATEITVHKAPKRPEMLDAKVHIIKPNGKTFTVFVGLLGERVYEVFALDNKQAGINDGMVGKIIKMKELDGSKIYNFESGPLLIRKLNAYEDSEASLVTRLISTALRHGTPLEFVVDQILDSKTLINSFPKAIAKALTLYIKDEEMKGKFKCEKCQSTEIQWEGLCRTCRSCGHSKCG